jgi:hypothetical protein
MKLLTEKQVKRFLKERTFIRKETIDAMCKSLTPIELPSDAEIEEASPYIPSNPKIDYLSYQKGFDKGAKWMKEQILNQNK